MTTQSGDIDSFDIAQEVGLDATLPEYEKNRRELSLQCVIFLLGRLLEDNPNLMDNIEKYKNEFVEQVKSERKNI